MKIKWYQKIRVRSVITAMVVAILAIAVFSALLQQTLQNYLISQKIGQIRRYASFVASDIAFSEDGGSDDMLPYEEEIDTFVRLDMGDRMMILNDEALVIQDSSKTKLGKYIVNNDVLTALSGTSVVERDGSYVRIAVPISERSGNSVIGIVYAFSTLDNLMSTIADVQQTILFWEMVIIGILVLIFIMYVLYLTKPIYQIRNWLRFMENGPVSAQSPLSYKNEYQEVVDGVQQVTQQLLDMDASRKVFVSNVSHELKTPLSSMKVLTESLLLQDHAPEEVYREFLQDINEEVDRQSALINDLLTLVRLDDSQNSMNIAFCSLNEMAEDILHRLKPFAEKMKVALVLENAREVRVECDEMKLTMALSNIVENGIKYNREDGKVTVTVDSDAHYARIRISDTGYGIEEEHFSKLFDRFYRVDKARDRGAGGTGLGLSIVKQVVLLHGGRISVESTVGEGTSFLVTIPLRYFAAHNSRNGSSKTASGEAPAGGGK